ncbi:hypothetical protein [Methylobacterium sp. Leaf108]|uniref:hypothetical protein n=1 Tax=Methylobacterium sp. Leaf108 TaxID=1736256 RepID=UPI0006FC5DA2|nr:hypothetical protein [Methylobacterium sp. Leaf108]KQP51709.1 hypothetical protein ASF39_07990 [Methylobacterium sp. Leaf108]
MIRTFILGTALALGLVSLAQADGFEPGREPAYDRPRVQRVVHHRRLITVRRRYVTRHVYHERHVRPIAPGGLTHSLNVPIYNVPPRRFP